MNFVNSFMSWYLRKRIPAIEHCMEHPAEVQEQTFKHLLGQLKKTRFGYEHHIQDVNSYREFKERIPIRNYDELKPYIEQVMKGEQKVLWPGDIKWFAKSSGTTSDKSKFIPVSYDALNDCQFRGSRDVLAYYYHNHPNAKVFQGKGLIIGGSHQVNELSANSYYGDLSAVMMNNLPFLATYLATPGMDIALMNDWEKKMTKMVDATINEDVTNISGVPTWTLLLIKQILERSGKSSLTEVWPNLELYVHGGVNFSPYRSQFEKLIFDPGIHYRETYNASEGFFGVQDEQGEDMLFMLDYGIFYEFVPMSELHKDNPKALWIDEIELNTNYALILNTNAGLWRYLLGDTIQFTSLKPLRFKITGRTKLYINAFGEELMIENAEQALAVTQDVCNCIVTEFTAAPIYLEVGKRGGHEWLIEFETEPEDLSYFTEVLDRELQKQNSDYEAKRQGDLALEKPIVNICPKGTFYNWMKRREKLGGQNKVPRLSNDRKILEDILTFEA
ncbi:GH3 auxin-responsive promoter family protein [bacterium]|nr:GH3 auxin-responsive promoter family protein [bacterium]